MSVKEDLQKTILIVDDDEVFRETLCGGLETSYKVVSAANAKEAIEILNQKSVDLVLTDVRMPGMSGYELIEWLAAGNQNRIPYIIMTGYVSLVESPQESGHSFSTITKPFKLSDIKELIEENLKLSEQKGVDEVATSRFCRVPISDIVTRSVLDFDIYLQLSEQNYVKVAYKDEELPLGQIKKYKQKGVNHLYIRREDFHKFVQFTFDLARAIKNNPEVAPSKKIAFLNYANKVMMEQVFVEGLNKENLESAKAFVELSVSTILESKEMLDLLELLKATDNQIYADSMAAALYSILIARELNYESALTAFKLCMAGLFQDIGKKEIEKEIATKPMDTLTNKELDILESHVVRSQKILESIKCVNADIIRLIQEHHEDLEGQGYPFGKKRVEQHPLSRILQCTNVFIENVNSRKMAVKQIDVSGVLNDIEKNYKNRVDPDCVNALRALFKVQEAGV
jgi:HD-GYP domain-containing protein (c-di-GMP phosphodiesterase class II)/ActR/RegA family two-component response regulator